MKDHNLNTKEFMMDEIESIELIGEKPTVDITVDDTHMFFANGIYTHNSSTNDDIIEAGSISDSYRKIMTADFVLSLSRKTEDKLKNTARFHVIKNRFGPDGITYNSSFDASYGGIDMYDSSSDKGKELQKKMANGEQDVKDFLNDKWQKISGNKDGDV